MINWTNDAVALGDLKPWGHNPRRSTKKQARALLDSMAEFGQVQTIAIGPEGEVYDGHQRLSALLTVHGKGYEVDARRSDRALTDDERRRLVVKLHAGAMGEWDFEALGNWDMSLLVENGFDQTALDATRTEMAFLIEMLGEGEEEVQAGEEGDAEPQIDRAAELQAEWGTELGQLWHIGKHRLLIGDCTVKENVARLMGGEKAQLIHADPPYGMGKEKDGIANDNLYRDKLDVFQMQWWKAARPHVEDNASAYIWGNAEDLWRLWYRGGLADSERLTFRNEVVWNKGAGMGQSSESHRMYPTVSERCLFFMLGEQGFNINADNYWEGWEPIRAYLDGERKESGLTTAQCNEICGKQNMTQSAFTRGGFRLILEEDYNALKQASNGKAFKRDYEDLKRDYEDLKREFYATRAYFDNTHDNMTDVWDFKRVTGEDRHGHATPKPVEMVKRAIKSSCPEGGLVYVPFGGTAPEFVAGENTGRRCYGMELSPAYGAVILQRMIDAFPDIDIYKAE